MPAAGAEEAPRAAVIPVGTEAEKAPATEYLDVKYYQAGSKTEPHGDGADVVFHPYSFSIDSENQVTASVELEPGLMKTGGSAGENSAKELDAGNRDTRKALSVTDKVAYDKNASVSYHDPDIHKVSVTGNTVTVEFDLGNPDATSFSVIAYTEDYNLMVSGETGTVIDGKTVYPRRNPATVEKTNSAEFSIIGNITRTDSSKTQRAKIVTDLPGGNGVTDLQAGETVYIYVTESPGTGYSMQSATVTAGSSSTDLGNTTPVLHPPKNLSGTISGSSYSLSYRTDNLDAVCIEVYAYTTNASLVLGGNEPITLDGKTVYLRGIDSLSFGGSGVYRTTLGNNTYVSLSHTLYCGSNPDLKLKPGEVLYFVVEETDASMSVTSGFSNTAKLTVMGGEDLTKDELAALKPQNVIVKQLNANTTKAELSVSWTGAQTEVDSYNFVTFLMVNNTPVKLDTSSVPHKIETAGPGVPANAVYQNNNGSCSFGPFTLDVLPAGGTQFEGYDSAGIPYGTRYVKDGDVLCVRLEGFVGRTGQYTPPVNDTIVIQIGSDEPVVIDLNSTNTSVVLTPEKGTYTGSQIKPTVEVTCNNNVLKLDQDYSVSYGENINAGKGAGSVTVTGQSSYSGNFTVSFDIDPATLDAEHTVITLNNATFTATGAEITPEVISVVCNGITLDKQDYDVSYKDNIQPGTGAVIVTGKRNWTGSASAQFAILADGQKIELNSNNTVITLEKESYTATGDAIEAKVTSVVCDNITLKDTDYTVSYTNNVNPGTATVTVTGVGDVTGSANTTFTITKHKLTDSDVKITVENATYTGKAVEPKVTVKADGKTLKEGTDYTLKYSSNKKIGTGTVTVKGKGIYSGSVKVKFCVNPKPTKLSSVKAGNKRMTVKWKKGSGITGYQIQYSLKKNMKSAKKVTVKGAKNVKKVIKGLKKKKTYYVRIRTYKVVKGKTYYSDWSAKKKVKIK